MQLALYLLKSHCLHFELPVDTLECKVLVRNQGSKQAKLPTAGPGVWA